MKKRLMFLVAVFVIALTVGTVHSEQSAVGVQTADSTQEKSLYDNKEGKNDDVDEPARAEPLSAMELNALETIQGTSDFFNTYYGTDAGDALTDEAHYNSLFGYQAGHTINTGDSNTVIGSAAGWTLTTQYKNTFVGDFSGYSATGNDNTFVGHNSGNGADPDGNSGSNNTFIGSGAGRNNTTGVDNVFVGKDAGNANTSGEYNTFVGHNTGKANSEADSNTFVGDSAGRDNTDGHHNTFVGDDAGTNNEDGHSNTFLGENAGQTNEKGVSNVFVGRKAGEKNYEGDENVFVGTNAGLVNEGGSYNAFLGFEAGNSHTNGQYNTFLGFKSGYSTIGGSSNTFVGNRAGYSSTDGMRNVFIGTNAGRNANVDDQLFIDNSDTPTPLIWGDFDARNVIVYGGFKAMASYSASDLRLKQNIEPLTSALNKVSGLQGITFEWREAGWLSDELKKSRQIGLVAQDVEKELPELVSEDKEGYKAVSYTKLTAVLVEAIKELKALNQQQTERMTEQQKKIEDQQHRFEKQQAEIEGLWLMIKELKKGDLGLT